MDVPVFQKTYLPGRFVTFYSLEVLAVDGVEDIGLLLLSLRVLRDCGHRCHVGRSTSLVNAFGRNEMKYAALREPRRVLRPNHSPRRNDHQCREVDAVVPLEAKGWKLLKASRLTTRQEFMARGMTNAAEAATAYLLLCFPILYLFTGGGRKLECLSCAFLRIRVMRCQDMPRDMPDMEQYSSDYLFRQQDGVFIAQERRC